MALARGRRSKEEARAVALRRKGGGGGSEHLSFRTFSVPGGCRLHDPELFNSSDPRYRGIPFNSLDSINYTGVRLQTLFPFSWPLPSPRPAFIHGLSRVPAWFTRRFQWRPSVVSPNNPVLIPRPRPRVVSRDIGVYQGKPLNWQVKVAKLTRTRRGREPGWCSRDRRTLWTMAWFQPWSKRESYLQQRKFKPCFRRTV